MKFKILTILGISLILSLQLDGQEKVNLYHPEANASEQLADAFEKAKESGKHVFIQVGGNWCSWCILFHKFIEENADIKASFDANYIAVKLNYSQENKNEDILAQLGYPTRFGFPVFVIMDGEGKQLHTQNSVYLEENKGYSKKNVLGFLSDWSPKALDPATYKN